MEQNLNKYLNLEFKDLYLIVLNFKKEYQEVKNFSHIVLDNFSSDFNEYCNC
jgi:hypothetical protein